MAVTVAKFNEQLLQPTTKWTENIRSSS